MVSCLVELYPNQGVPELDIPPASREVAKAVGEPLQDIDQPEAAEQLVPDRAYQTIGGTSLVGVNATSVTLGNFSKLGTTSQVRICIRPCLDDA